MTLATLITKIEKLRPSQFDKDELTDWVNEIESQVVDQIFNKAEGDEHVFTPYKYDEDYDRELMLPEQHTDIYLHYLAAKIDYWNSEIERFNNSAAMYQSAWDSYAAEYRRNNMPKQLKRPCHEWWPDPLRRKR